jgi:carboxylesterase
MPSLPRKPNRCQEIDSYIYPYDYTPLACIGELKKLMRIVRRSLKKVTVPTLIVQSEKDETVVPKSAQYIYDRIGSTVKHLSWYKNSSHVIVIDKERNKLFQEIGNFINTTKKRGIS